MAGYLGRNCTDTCTPGFAHARCSPRVYCIGRKGSPLEPGKMALLLEGTLFPLDIRALLVFEMSQSKKTSPTFRLRKQ